MLTQAPKGTRDILPSEIYKWHYLEKVIAELCRSYGYKEIRLPVFEHTELFQRGVGDTTDIVQKEMYTFEDKGGRSISLRPEGTAGVVRSYIEHGMASLPQPIKLYYNITAYRYENVQKGRYREFHQFGVEAFGAQGPAIDVEIISMLNMLFKKLGLQSIELRINSIGCPACRGAYHQLLKEYLQPHLDNLCETCNNRFVKNPLRILDCKEEKCKRVTQGAPALLDHLCEECRGHLEGLKKGLDSLDISYTVDPNIVRGLDYYTKTVFEFVSGSIGAQGTVCGGGRYDGLMEACGGNPTSGIGFGLGLERLLLQMDSENIDIPAPEGIDIYIANIGEAAGVYAAKLVYQLRTNGIAAEKDLMGKSLKAQMKYADKLGARYSVVLGDDEINNNTAAVKDMATGTQTQVALDRLMDFIQGCYTE